MVYFEHVFKDGTGVRLADVPYEHLKREIPTLSFRITRQGQKPKVVKAMLYDMDTKEELFPKLVDSLFQVKVEEIGRLCETEGCNNHFLPHGPAHKICDACKEAK